MHEVTRLVAGGTGGRGDRERLRAAQDNSGLASVEPIVDRILAVAEATQRVPAGQRDEVGRGLAAIVAAEARLLLGDGLPVVAALALFERESEHLDRFVDGLGKMLGRLLALMPNGGDGHAALTLEVPLIAMTRRPEVLLTDLIERCIAWSFDDKDAAGELVVGAALAGRIKERLCRASGVTEKQARENPHGRLKWPRGGGNVAEMVAAYFGGTGLEALLLLPVRLPVVDATRMEHAHVVMGAGGGKTQFLQYQFARDLDRPPGAEVGMVVLDSQTDLISKLSRLKLFEDSDRLIVVDPSDVEFPVALNLFSLGGTSLADLPMREREQIKAAREKLYAYVIGALLGSELTNKMGTAFSFLVQLMLTVEGATIHTLLACLEEPKDFMGHIERLPWTAQRFLTREFMDKEFAPTRKQIVRRLYGVLKNETFERMFGAKENKLDLYAALNAGKVVLINTSRDFLQDECQTFGRYMIALTLAAAFNRARTPERERRYSFLIIDEASDYFDDNIAQLLVQARKYRLGVVMLHQALEQMSDGLRDIVMSNTAIKMCGSVSAKDARYLAPELRTSPEFILAQEKDAGGTRFACHVRNVTPEAVSLRIPFGVVEAMPVMSEAAYGRFLDANRKRIATPYAEIDIGRTGGGGDAGGGAGDGADDFSVHY